MIKIKTKVSTLAATIITIGSLVGGANGAVTLYTDAALWRSEVSGTLTDENFDIVADDTSITFRTGLISTATGPGGVHDSFTSAPAFSGYVSDHRPSGVTDGYYGIRWTFPRMIDSFFTYIEIPSSSVFSEFILEGLGSAFSAGDGVFFYDNVTDGYTGVIGVISDTPFNEIQFYAPSGGVNFVSTVVEFNTVPEPSSTLLLGLSSGVLLMRRRG